VSRRGGAYSGRCWRCVSGGFRGCSGFSNQVRLPRASARKEVLGRLRDLCGGAVAPCRRCGFCFSTNRKASRQVMSKVSTRSRLRRPTTRVYQVIRELFRESRVSIDVSLSLRTLLIFEEQCALVPASGRLRLSIEACVTRAAKKQIRTRRVRQHFKTMEIR
jgi:hypothetical protein